MSDFYTSTIILVCLSLGVLSLLVHENARIQRRDKRLLYLTYLLIAIAALAEYCGVFLSGKEGISSKALLIIKMIDYIVTPMAGGAIILQLRLQNKWNWFLVSLIGANTLLQLLSPLWGWMVRVDENNVYHHGPLYPLYIGMCMTVICVVIFQFLLYGRSFRRQNRKSLYAILLLILIGVAMQELSDAMVRTSYLALMIGAALIFIHYVEFGAQALEDDLQKQKIQLDTDALTGVYSRFAYALALKELDREGTLPEELVAFTVDINGLKQVNDQLGHEAGDELICGAADCIKAALCKNGRCYRTGGDEFVVLALMEEEKVRDALAQLRRETTKWRGETLRTLSVSAGYALASKNKGLSAEKLVGVADKAMYEAKAAYYRNSGRDRRRH